MPAMTGDEMVARMRAFTPGFKVLFVSGYAESKDAGTRVENDAATFLAKPFTPAALAMKVRSILD
jgi:CheY-like chemotaxis protein